ncbi:MAG: hypothetical protein ACI3ZR_10865, partial [bacterium]
LKLIELEEGLKSLEKQVAELKKQVFVQPAIRTNNIAEGLKKNCKTQVFNVDDVAEKVIRVLASESTPLGLLDEIFKRVNFKAVQSAKVKSEF